jgi:hypothetical protein
MKLVDVEMQNVEFFRELAYSVEHPHVIGVRVADIAVEPDAPRWDLWTNNVSSPLRHL